MINEVLRSCYEGWRASWFKDILTRISTIADFFDRSYEEGNPANQFLFIRAYLDSSSVMRGMFSSFIRDDDLRLNFNRAIEIFEIMDKKYWLNDSIIRLVIRHNLEGTTCIKNTLDYLQRIPELFTYDNCLAIVRHLNVLNLFPDALTRCHGLGRLDQAGFNMLVQTTTPMQVLSVMQILSRGDIYTPTLCQSALAHADPDSVAKALVMLHRDGYDSEDIVDAVLGFNCPPGYTINDFAQLMMILDEKNSLTENLAAVEACEEIRRLHLAVIRMVNAGLLTSRHLSLLLNRPGQILLQAGMNEIVWDVLAPWALEENWEAILQACAKTNPVQALKELRNRILSLQFRPNPDDDVARLLGLAAAYR
jgi:hypothetical protein